MAKLADILAIERERVTDFSRRQIHLFADGSFYRAYEWSAWLCCGYINQFKVTKRYNKSIDRPCVHRFSKNQFAEISSALHFFFVAL